MLLAADIGNTNITLGIFDNDKLIQTFRLESNPRCAQKEFETQLETIAQNYHIDSCVIVSVVKELSNLFKQACENTFKLEANLFTSYKDFDIEIGIESPETIGADRLANACSAMSYKLPAIVIDIGTAITFDIVSREGVFLGGIIMPGLNLQFNSLNQYTSKLPLLKPEISTQAIGNCTKTAILSGVIRGTAGAIDSLIQQCEIELGEKATIIATGGQCKIVSEYSARRFDFINPDLTLEGIKQACLTKNKHVNLY